MTEHRFFVKHNYTCPECGSTLQWKRRYGQKDSMILFHRKWRLCSRSEKKYYAPAVSMNEVIPLPEDEA